jgi:hypothetical protein
MSPFTIWWPLPCGCVHGVIVHHHCCCCVRCSPWCCCHVVVLCCCWIVSYSWSCCGHIVFVCCHYCCVVLVKLSLSLCRGGPLWLLSIIVIVHCGCHVEVTSWWHVGVPGGVCCILVVGCWPWPWLSIDMFLPCTLWPWLSIDVFVPHPP